MLAQQARQVVAGQPLQQAGTGGLADGEPAGPEGGVLEFVEHDRLAQAARTHDEDRAGRGAGAAAEGVLEGGQGRVAPGQDPGRDPKDGEKGLDPSLI